MTPVADQIFFDEQDASLFLVDDARLRADALKHSLVPRLRRVMNAAIAGIRDIYGIEVLDDSIISVYPNFREKRKTNSRSSMIQLLWVWEGKESSAGPAFPAKMASLYKFCLFVTLSFSPRRASTSCWKMAGSKA